MGFTRICHEGIHTQCQMLCSCSKQSLRIFMYLFRSIAICLHVHLSVEYYTCIFNITQVAYMYRVTLEKPIFMFQSSEADL